MKRAPVKNAVVAAAVAVVADSAAVVAVVVASAAAAVVAAAATAAAAVAVAETAATAEIAIATRPASLQKLQNQKPSRFARVFVLIYSDKIGNETFDDRR
jgi:hypothetical protein